MPIAQKLLARLIRSQKTTANHRGNFVKKLAFAKTIGVREGTFWEYFGGEYRIVDRLRDTFDRKVTDALNGFTHRKQCRKEPFP